MINAPDQQDVGIFSHNIINYIVVEYKGVCSFPADN